MYGLSREDMRPGSTLHEKIRKNLDARYTASSRRMERLHDKWRKSEERFIAYLPEKEVDAQRRVLREQEGKPQFTTLVLPYTYALAMSAHSYWTTVFLARSPIFQYTGRHGETQQQIQAVEALVDYQLMAGEMLVPLHLWLLDPAKFGIGVLGCYWDEEVTYTSEYQEVEQNFLGLIPTGKMKRELVTVKHKGYMGNKLFNIRPYDWYPDPRVALWEVQKAEFHGIYREVGWGQLVRGAKAGTYTNIDVLRERRKRGEYGGVARVVEARSEQLSLPNDDVYATDDWDIRETGPFGIVEFYVDLIPKEWGLSQSDYPEKWCFTTTLKAGSHAQPQVSGSKNVDVVIGARPLGAFHGKFPLFVLQMEPEAYAFSSRAMTDVLGPLQDAMDWLFNAHMFNVRKVMNDQFVVDPSRIVLGDLLDPLPGNIIRLKRAAYGTDPKTAISQLNVVDVTRQHIQDMGTIHEFAQRAVGVTDQIMGMIDAGGRKSATEVRTSSTFGVNRQKTVAEYFSAMGFSPLASVLVSTSQQYYDMQQKFRVAGDLMLEAGQGLVDVNPEMIAGNYDFIPVDGTLPIDRYAQANLWREILTGMNNMPIVAMQYDVGRIFAWVAQIAGLKNITRFRLQVQPDEALIAAARAGNVVPMKQPSGASLAGGPERTGEPGQVSGMGQTS